MAERQQGAARDVEGGAEGEGAEEGEDRHAVHVVGDGFGGGDAEAAPAFAGGGFEAFEDVEVGEGGGGVGWRGVGDGGEDCGWGVSGGCGLWVVGGRGEREWGCGGEEYLFQ